MEAEREGRDGLLVPVTVAVRYDGARYHEEGRWLRLLAGTLAADKARQG